MFTLEELCTFKEFNHRVRADLVNTFSVEDLSKYRVRARAIGVAPKHSEKSVFTFGVERFACLNIELVRVANDCIRRSFVQVSSSCSSAQRSYSKFGKEVLFTSRSPSVKWLSVFLRRLMEMLGSPDGECNQRNSLGA